MQLCSLFPPCCIVQDTTGCRLQVAELVDVEAAVPVGGEAVANVER